MTFVDPGLDLKEAWHKARLLTGRPRYTKAYDGMCLGNGVWYINPRGGVEGVLEAVWQGGVDWFGLNIHEGDWTQPCPGGWDTVRFRAHNLNRPTIPWQRTYVEYDVWKLIYEAKRWQSLAIGINLEEEAKDFLPPAKVKALLDRECPPNIEPIIFPPAWLYNAVDWTPLAEYAFVLQMYDTPESKKPLDCVAHAHALGVRNVFFCYDGRKTPPSPLREPWSAYGDDAAGSWYPRG